MAKRIKTGIKKKKERIKLFDYKQNTFGFSGTNIQIFGNSQVNIDGASSIMEYNDYTIKINTGKKSVAFYGKNLKITNLGENAVTILGEITSLEFCG